MEQTSLSNFGFSDAEKPQKPRKLTPYEKGRRTIEEKRRKTLDESEGWKVDLEKEFGTIISNPTTEEGRKFVREMLERGENWHYAEVTLHGDLGEGYLCTDYFEEIKFDADTGKRSDTLLGGSFDGGETYGIEEIPKLLADLTEFRRSELTKPFGSKKGNFGCMFRHVRDENIRVFLSARAKALLEKHGVDVGEFNRKLMALKGRGATERDHERWERCELVKREIERIEKRLGEIQKAVRFAFDTPLSYEREIYEKKRSKGQTVLDPKSMDALKAEFDRLEKYRKEYQKEYERFRAEFWK